MAQGSFVLSTPPWLMLSVLISTLLMFDVGEGMLVLRFGPQERNAGGGIGGADGGESPTNGKASDADDDNEKPTTTETALFKGRNQGRPPAKSAVYFQYGPSACNGNKYQWKLVSSDGVPANNQQPATDPAPTTRQQPSIQDDEFARAPPKPNKKKDKKDSKKEKSKKKKGSKKEKKDDVEDSLKELDPEKKAEREKRQSGYDILLGKRDELPGFRQNKKNQGKKGQSNKHKINKEGSEDMVETDSGKAERQNEEPETAAKTITSAPRPKGKSAVYAQFGKKANVTWKFLSVSDHGDEPAPTTRSTTQAPTTEEEQVKTKTDDKEDGTVWKGYNRVW